MWTSVRVPQTPKQFKVNHFVPLVLKDSCVKVTAVKQPSKPTCIESENLGNRVDDSLHIDLGWPGIYVRSIRFGIEF